MLLLPLFYTIIHLKLPPKYNTRRALRSLKRRNSFKKKKTAKNKSYIGLGKKQVEYKKRYTNKYRFYRHVRAPKDFSFLKNPQTVIGFINILKKHFDAKIKVFVVLKHVTDIDYGSIVVLLAIMIRFKSQKIAFDGNVPDNQYARSFLESSGFFEGLSRTYTDTDQYQVNNFNSSYYQKWKKHKNTIHTHARKRVDAELGLRITQIASETIWGEKYRYPGVQKILLELMQNTNNHASEESAGVKHWWLSINHNEEKKMVSFCFVDFGIGVFKSLESKPTGSIFYGALDIVKKLVNYRNNADFLKLILDGTMHTTVTNKPYRRKGLPGIAETLRRNQISNLFVITNNVFANVSKDKYHLLNDDFEGTFLYWELDTENGNYFK